MKKTSNAEYADDRLIDLRQLDHLQFDDVHEAYHLDWSSMLLLMRWLHDGEDSTIVIDRRGDWSVESKKRDDQRDPESGEARIVSNQENTRGVENENQNVAAGQSHR